MDDVVCLEVSVPSDDFAIGQVLASHGDVRLDLARFVPDGESFAPYVWVETRDQAAFADHVESDDRVADLAALDPVGERTLYKLEWDEFDDELIAAITRHDLVIESATGTADRWRFRLRGPNHRNLTAFQQELLDLDVRVDVHRIWRPEPSDEGPYGLTEKQRETLALAYREGYFSTPRTASLEDLGEMLGVSHQSVSRRIRVGVENLLEGTLMSDGRRHSG